MKRSSRAGATCGLILSMVLWPAALPAAPQADAPLTGTRPAAHAALPLAALNTEATKVSGISELGPESGAVVRFIGRMQTAALQLRQSCRGVANPALCVELQPAGALVQFDRPNLAELTLPARSAQTLLCHWLSSNGSLVLRNANASGPTAASVRLEPYVEIWSRVLEDPALVNVQTGQPFAGMLESGFGPGYSHQQSLQAGAFVVQGLNGTRACHAGFLSLAQLLGTGLDPRQAAEVFAAEITLRIGIRGHARLVDEASVAYALRILGD